MNICHCIFTDLFESCLFKLNVATTFAKENELTDSESCNICALGIGYTVYGICTTVYRIRLYEKFITQLELNTMYCIQITINSQVNLTHTDLLLYIVHVLVWEYCLRQSIRQKIYYCKTISNELIKLFHCCNIQFEKLFRLLNLKVISKLLLFGYPFISNGIFWSTFEFQMLESN